MDQQVGSLAPLDEVLATGRRELGVHVLGTGDQLIVGREHQRSITFLDPIAERQDLMIQFVGGDPQSGDLEGLTGVALDEFDLGWDLVEAEREIGRVHLVGEGGLQRLDRTVPDRPGSAWFRG